MKFAGLLMLIFPLMTLAGRDTNPCEKDFKNFDCYRKIRSDIFSVSSWGKEHDFGKPHAKAIEDYWKKYGIAGFSWVDESSPKDETLFEKVFQSEGEFSHEMRKKLLTQYTPGMKLGNKNIYQVLLKQPRYHDNEDLKNYLSHLELLFPREGNDKLDKTLQQFGAPWDDPNFLSGYLNETKQTIKFWEESDEFFKHTTNPEYKSKLKAELERLEPLARIPDEICQATSLDQIKLAKEKMPELFKSPARDVVGCLLENKQCQLVTSLIEEDLFPAEKLPVYFDQILEKNNGPQCATPLQAVFMKMAEKGISVSDKYITYRHPVVQNFSGYVKKHPEEYQNMCAAPLGGGWSALDRLENSMNKVVQVQAFDVLDRIIQEPDRAKQDELIDQLVQIYEMLPLGAGIDPKTNKTVLLKLAEHGDEFLLDRIVHKGVSLYAMGLMDEVDEKTPIEYAITAGTIDKFKFAKRLYELGRSEEQLIYITHGALKRFHPKDDELKLLKQDLKGSVKADLSHIY